MTPSPNHNSVFVFGQLKLASSLAIEILSSYSEDSKKVSYKTGKVVLPEFLILGNVILEVTSQTNRFQ